MAGISLSGLSSGLDTASIVDQLIAVERNPQVLLNQKRTKQNTVITALQGLNTRLASLATAAEGLSRPPATGPGPSRASAWTTPLATSSSPTVTTTTSAGSGAGSLTFDVAQLAAKASVTTPVTTDGTYRQVKITQPSGDPVLVEAEGRTVVELAAAINAKDAGVVATAVRTGTDPSGGAVYQLLVTAAASGEAGGFSLEVDGAPVADTRVPAPGVTAGRDARIVLEGGLEISSPSNTFTGLMSGVDATVTKLESGVTVTSAPDASAPAKQTAALVGSLNVVLSEITAQSRATVGSTGALVGSSLLRGIQQQLASTVSTAVPGASLADLGIQLTRDGTVKIDEKAFAAYAAKEPARAEAMTSAFAEAVGAVAKSASRTGTGLVSQAITSGQSSVKDLDTRIAAWDDRLVLRRTTLERQFASLEVALQRSQSQQSYLSGALSSLTASSGR